MFYRIWHTLLWLPFKIFYPTLSYGKQNIPKGGVIFACNHYTYWDAFLLALSTFRKQRFLGKKEIYKNKFLAFICRLIRIIPVDRGKADINAVKESVKALKNNEILSVFPEGTRNKTSEELGEVKSGIVMFAIKAQKPIIPIIFNRRPKLFRLTKIIYGTPFSFEQFYDKKLSKEILEEGSVIMTNELKALREKYSK